MTKIITAMECDCETCNGGTPAPEGYYGGSYCVCSCHKYKLLDEEMLLEILRRSKKPLVKTKLLRIAVGRDCRRSSFELPDLIRYAERMKKAFTRLVGKGTIIYKAREPVIIVPVGGQQEFPYLINIKMVK